MRLDDFILEKWLNPKDSTAKYNLGVSCVKPLTVNELFELIDEDVSQFLDTVKNMSLHYGHFFGLERLLDAISKMYKDINKSQVLTVHGGTGANNMVITEIAEPGKNVVAILPNYQQHYSIPKSVGAEVKKLKLDAENGYKCNMSELEKLVDKNTCLITLSNPNNPTGAYMTEQELTEIGKIAKKADAYVLSDEIYHGLDEEYMASIVDVYEKGIVTSSTSKVFSMAGTRVGWIVTKDKDMHDRLENRRSYDTICDGVFDELITAIAFEKYDLILERNRKIVNEGKEIFEEWISTRDRLSSDYKSLGTTSLVSYDYDINSTELCDDIFEKTGVLLCHGDCFEMPKTFRLGYGIGDNENLRKGLAVLGQYFEELERK